MEITLHVADRISVQNYKSIRRSHGVSLAVVVDRYRSRCRYLSVPYGRGRRHFVSLEPRSPFAPRSHLKQVTALGDGYQQGGVSVGTFASKVGRWKLSTTGRGIESSIATQLNVLVTGMPHQDYTRKTDTA
jgi:hypothetical protein